MSHGATWAQDEDEAARADRARERIEALRSDRIGVGQRLHDAMRAVRDAERGVKDAQHALAQAQSNRDVALKDFRDAYDK